MGFFSNVKANIDGGVGNFKMKWDDASRSYDDDEDEDVADIIDKDEDDDDDDEKTVVKGKIITGFGIPQMTMITTNEPKAPISELLKMDITKDSLTAILPAAICDVFGCEPMIGTATASIMLKIAGDVNFDKSKLSNLDVDAIAKTAVSFGYDANTIVTVLSIIDKFDDVDVDKKIADALKNHMAKKPMTVGMNFDGVGQQPILVG